MIERAFAARTGRLIQYPTSPGAQFLNLIELGFSVMAKAIISTSDYNSVDAPNAAIDRHFTARYDLFARFSEQILAADDADERRF